MIGCSRAAGADVYVTVMTVVACPNCGAKNRVDETRAGQMQPVCGRCGQKLTGASAVGTAHPVTVTDQSLASELGSAGGKPVLVDCWAPWCGPCRRIAPVMDELAAESAGRYVVAKLNVDENPGTARQFRVDGIPALLIFKNGQLVDKLVGLQPKQAIAARLAAHA
jgi:thioredoxin 2